MGRGSAAVVLGIAAVVAAALLLSVPWPHGQVSPVAHPTGPEEGTSGAPGTAAAAEGTEAADAGGAASTPWLQTPTPSLELSLPEPAPEPEPDPPAGPPPALAGIVATEDWFRVPDAEVLLTSQRPVRERGEIRLAGAVAARTRTDAEGRFAFASVPGAEYHVAVLRAQHPQGGALLPGYATVVARPPARAGEPSRPDEVTLKLCGRAVFWVRVVDSDGSPVAGARVLYRGLRWPVNSDADGWAGLAVPGNGGEADLEVRVIPPDGRRDLEAAAGPASSGTIALSRGRVVTGIVVDADGRPAAGAVLTYTSGPSSGESSHEGRGPRGGTARAREDGTFVIAALRGEDVTIQAAPSQGSGVDQDYAWIRVPVGASNVRLALPPVGDVTIAVAGIEGTASVALRREGGDDDPGAEGAGPPLPEGLSRDIGARWMSGSAVRFTDAGGRVKFPGVRTDRAYVAWMIPDTEGRTFVLRGVRASEHEIEATAAPGLPTSVRLVGEEWRLLRVWARNDVGVAIEGDRDGLPRCFPGLPAGTWEVVAVVAKAPFFDDDAAERRGVTFRRAPGGGPAVARVQVQVVAGREAVIEPPR